MTDLAIGSAPQRLSLLLRAAWAWWIAELLDLLPVELRRTIGGLRRRLVLTIEGEMARLAWEAGNPDDQHEVWDSFDLATTEPSALHERLSAITGSNRPVPPVIMKLPASSALHAPMVLPIAAQRNLAQVVAFEFERFTPFARETVYFNYRIVSRDTAAARLNLELVVIRRETVDHLLDAIRQLGVDIARVEVEGSTLPVPLRDESKTAGSMVRVVRMGVLALVVTACVLTALAIVIPMYRAEEQAAQLAQEVAGAKRQADAAQKLRSQIEAEIEDRRSVSARRRQSPTVSEILGALTHLLPDDSWLTELQINGSTLQISGFANSATTLLGALDQSPLLSNAAFRSSVTQDAEAARERFDISAQIRQRADPHPPATKAPVSQPSAAQRPNR